MTAVLPPEAMEAGSRYCSCSARFLSLFSFSLSFSVSSLLLASPLRSSEEWSVTMPC